MGGKSRFEEAGILPARGDGGGVNSRLPLAVPGVANAGALAAGRYHACVVQEDGSVRC